MNSSLILFDEKEYCWTTIVTCCRNLVLKTDAYLLLSVMSLNIPSSFDVNWQPHSVLSLLIIIFSESSEADFWLRRRRARCRL